ncbi:Hpt domain-containing protein [Polaromonas eurypsychrophila]|uniref:HPt domain-containing protein n=1 Tax=Polaromonas eurypsychrophila TaxID=1614635 RepID=A0A916S7K6_9BURK|nr:Hpt domain-containing protein [Polaromonas eurypsychrophila]GGA87495.1 hypothetical protein GCM10011496_05170 [Polaromonas eurypsychrophila]
MSTQQQLFQQFLDEQRREYGRSLPGKLGQIEAQWRLAAAVPSAAEPLAQLERLAHTLAGTAGTLGYMATGHAAKALELLLQEAAQAGAGGPGLHAEIERAICCLQDSLPDAAVVPPGAPTQTPDNSPDNPKAAT